MLAKLETRSNRVKGISFHPTRPWILASLHNGVIQLWDYRIRTLVDKFDEHDGPVRGVCFHYTQPLFVSGGDDYKIKVWNYKQRRCLFTLLGHLDYIRTVEFHREYPWILSASDDQTIRIWNWQSRNCIAVLTGHNHYVMCASFHPKEDLVVSASLDQTVRVWDISGLRKKTVSPAGGMMPHGMHHHHQEDSLRLPQNELFGNTDAIVKYALEGHDRGVNWAAFHPSSPLIVSGADDRQVKLWRMNDTKAWEVDTFRGHFNNVSCAIFHPRQELVISNSEDKTIRVWDISKRTCIQTFRREHDRFWILTAHPETNLFAAGHDSGMIVFKLERERPAYIAQQNDLLFYIKDKYVRSCELASSRDVPVLSIRGRTAGSTGRIKSLSFSLQDKAILIATDTDGGNYELYLVPKGGSGDNVDSKKGAALAAVFFGRQRFAVLDKSQQIIVKNLKNEETRRCVPPHPIDNLYAAPAGMLLLRGEDKVSLFDVQQKRVMGELSVNDVRSVFWSFDASSLVALVSKETITIANKKLEQLCTVHETMRIKSGAWDENGVFIYSTPNHIKFCLPNGDNGIIRTMDNPLYITAVRGTKVYCLDRECKLRVIAVDNTEYMFKLALVQRKYSTVLKMIKEYNLIGQSIVSYLQKKGFPEVALYFVKDEKTRFNLALECGSIEIALESAKALDDKESWHRLGVEALRQGNHQIVEMAYQRTKNFERLSFLYLITGNVEKLRKMLKIAEMRGDINSRLHNALYVGDVNERIRLLEEVGQYSLAYVTAATHGLTAEAEAIAAKLNGNLPTVKPDAQLLFPPIPVMRLHESNWPLLTVSKGYFEGAMKEEDKKFVPGLSDVPEEEVGAQWGDVDIPEEDGEKPPQDNADILEEPEPTEKPESSEPGAWADLDVDIGVEDEEPTTSKQASSTTNKAFAVLPQPGPSIGQVWCNNSNLAADHAAAGNFESAMKLLNHQIGAVNFAPLKSHFLALYTGSRAALSTIGSVPSLPIGLLRNAEAGYRSGVPAVCFALQPLIDDRLKSAYRAVTAGKFNEALNNFLYIMHAIPFLVLQNKKEVNEVKELLGICRDYVTGLRIELQRKDVQDPVKQVELAAYFTHCNLQQVHLILSLRSAMNVSYKAKNYLTAASFGRRLLELEPTSEVATQARKVVKFAETNAENAYKLNYDERNPFIVCTLTFTPIYKGNASVQCPYCSAHFAPSQNNKLCGVCGIAQVGKQTSGLTLISERSR